MSQLPPVHTVNSGAQGLPHDLTVRKVYDRIQRHFPGGAGYDGMSNDDAVAHGIKTTAAVVTSAAIVMVAVFAIFATQPPGSRGSAPSHKPAPRLAGPPRTPTTLPASGSTRRPLPDVRQSACTSSPLDHDAAKRH
jgi:hypothetical protein